MRINNIYDKHITIENIYDTWQIVKRTCKNKRAVLRFELNENTNIVNIYRILKSNNYKPGRFILFIIFQPKPRLVMSQNITDKVINHFVANYYLIPYLSNKLIDKNIATRKNKGTGYGLKYVEDSLNALNMKRKDIYCLKLDIKKYFYNIDHNILINKLKKDIKDKKVIKLIEDMIRETNKPYINEFVKIYNKNFNLDIPEYGSDIGLSIGAQANQFLAIYFLDEVDHYAKEVLKCKYYIRYQDDIVIFDNDKEKLLYVWKKIEEKINKLHLKLNDKTNIYNMKNGINFLGYNYKIRNNHLSINYNKKTIRKIKHKLDYLYRNDLKKYYLSYGSYYGYLSKVKRWEKKFKMKIEEKYEYYKEKYPNYIILLKEGSFYKTIKEDAMIMWQIFGYKWNKDMISFGMSPYSKVINELNRISINYIISDENEKIIKNNDDIYDLMLKISKINYDKYKKRKELKNLLDEIISTDIFDYDKIKKILEKELKEIEKVTASKEESK